MAFLIDKSAGPAIHFVAVYVDGPIGMPQEEAEKWAKELTRLCIVAAQLKRAADGFADLPVFTNAIAEDTGPKDRGVFRRR